MPEKNECRYCGRINDASSVECENCSASLSDAIRQAFCDKCGIPLGDGVSPVGKCVTCKESVYLCDKHRKKVVGEEIFCKEHESECFIATAVFGTPLDPQIDELREFRDGWLLNNPLGRAAVYTYYEISPSIARAAGKNEILKELLRRTVVQPALKLTRTLFGKRE